MDEINKDMVEIEDDDYLYYRGVRLKTGELLIAGIPKDDLDYTRRQYIEIYSPLMLIETTAEEDGVVYQAYGMRQWMPLSADDFFEIDTDSIQTMFDIADRYIDVYFATLEKLEGNNVKQMLQEEAGEGDPELLQEDMAPDAERSKYLH